MRRNITFSADENLIRKARERAAREHTNLNSVFREWLARYAQTGESDYAAVMDKLKHIRPGRKFSRDELNER